MPAEALLVGVASVFFLQVTGIGQEQFTEFERGRRSIDNPSESLLCEARYIPRMVKVGVSQHHPVNARCGNGQCGPVSQAKFLGALEEPAIDH